MTVDEMVKKYPNAAQAIYDQGFADGLLEERAAWEKRVLSEQETDQVIDGMIAAAMTP